MSSSASVQGRERIMQISARPVGSGAFTDTVMVSVSESGGAGVGWIDMNAHKEIFR